MKHIYIKGTSKQTLLLLHGTGGNENDLVSLAKYIDPTANILSVRGQVVENGMPRFFKRLSPGVFDEDDLILRTHELKSFIDTSSHTYDFDIDHIIAFGYSNGANIASSLIIYYPTLLKTAILSHPMVPFNKIEMPDLKDIDIFIGAGNNDPIVDLNETYQLETLYKQAHANITLKVNDFGHNFSQKELDEIKNWYKTVIKH